MCAAESDYRSRLLRSLERSGVFLVEELSEGLGRYARARGLDETSAEEVVQEAFATILVKRPRVDSPEAWLMRVVHRRCTDWHRRRRVAERALGELAARRPSHSAPATTEAMDLEGALACLPARTRRLLLMSYLGGLSSSELASELGYATASIPTLLRRALDALRKALGVEHFASDTRSPLPQSRD
jgi:RNA polymerase sigma-70 factor, ECF subfamily